MTYHHKNIDTDGSIYYFDEKNQFHREDGPAVKRSDGYEAWYIHGKRHREDGPAITYKDGSIAWCVNDSLHKLDGPAVDIIDGYKSWCKNGKVIYYLKRKIVFI